MCLSRSGSRSPFAPLTSARHAARGRARRRIASAVNNARRARCRMLGIAICPPRRLPRHDRRALPGRDPRLLAGDGVGLRCRESFPVRASPRASRQTVVERRRAASVTSKRHHGRRRSHASQLVFVLLLLVVGRLRRPRAEAAGSVPHRAARRRRAGELRPRDSEGDRSTPTSSSSCAPSPALRSAWRRLAGVSRSTSSANHFASAVGLVAFTWPASPSRRHGSCLGSTGASEFVLGAIVSPTDANRRHSTAKEMALPRRVGDVLEAKSLVNDANRPAALEFGVLILAWGNRPSLPYAASASVILVVCGIAVGLLLGRRVDWFERRIDDGPIEIAISLPSRTARISSPTRSTPPGYRRSSRRASSSAAGARASSPAVRLQAYAVWDALTFMLNGSSSCSSAAAPRRGRRNPRRRARPDDPRRRACSALVIALRLIWVFPAARLSYFIRRRILAAGRGAPTRQQLSSSLVGMARRHRPGRCHVGRAYHAGARGLAVQGCDSSSPSA